MNKTYKHFQILAFLFFINATAFAQLNITFDIQAPTCNGYTNGSVTANISNGTPPYIYSWNTPAADNTAFSISEGNYTVNVTDANGLTGSATANVQAPAPVTGVIAIEGNLCMPTGLALNAIGNGGVAPYTYSWNNGSAQSNNTNPQMGINTVTITDANGCTSTVSQMLSEALSVEVEIQGVQCNDFCDGGAMAIVMGGTAPFSYAWSNGNMNQNNFPLPPGTYTVTVTDANGCTAMATGVIENPPAFDISIDVVADCTNGGSADLTVMPNGGVPNYTILWSTGADTPTLTGVDAGFYGVTVTDSNGCQQVDQVVVSGMPGMDVNITGTDVSCNGGNDGTAMANITGGTAPYNVVWSNGQTTNPAIGLAPGPITATVTDAAGCVTIATFTIGSTTDFSLTFTTTETACGAMNGSAMVNVNGGSGNFSYEWTNGSMTNTSNGLAGGATSVTVLDNVSGCNITQSVDVPQSVAITFDLETESSNCTGNNDGSASISNISANAAMPVSIEWSTGTSADMMNIDGLATGDYSVTLTDANDCFAIQDFTIDAGNAIIADFTYEALTCGTDGFSVEFTDASISTPSTTAIMMWEWTVGGLVVSMDQNPILDLPFGETEVTLMVLNVAGCSNQITMDLSLDGIDVDVPNELSACNEPIQVNTTNNGGGEINYDWSSNGLMIDDETIANPIVTGPVGNYELYVAITNDLGCVQLDTVDVEIFDDTQALDPSLVEWMQCDSFTLDYTNGNAEADNSMWIFDYPNGTDTEIGSPVSYAYAGPGIYTIAIIPMEGCYDTLFMDVEVFEAPMIAYEYDLICTETVGINFTDLSSTPYPIDSWEWTFGDLATSDEQNPNIEITEALDLEVIFTIDFGGCSLSDTSTIAVNPFQPVLPAAEVVACMPNEPVELWPDFDPTLDYVCSWSPATNLDDPNTCNPTAIVDETTTYELTIMDINGTDTCAVMHEVTVLVAPMIMLQDIEDIATCSDDQVNLSAQTGDDSITYQWLDENGQIISTGSEFSLIPQCPAQAYVLIATDTLGCMASDDILIGNYEIMASSNPVGQNLTPCVAEPAAYVILNDKPENPFDVMWSPFDPTQNGIAAEGTFEYTITNQWGCEETNSITVSPVDLSGTITATATPDTILQGETSQLMATAIEGYDYEWNNGLSLDNDLISNPLATPEETTEYTVEVINENGCTTSATTRVVVIPPGCTAPDVFFPNAFTPDGDDLNDVLLLRGNFIDEAYFAIYNRWGEKVFETNDMNVGWDGSHKGESVCADVYGYYLTIKCSNGEEYYEQGNVSLLR